MTMTTELTEVNIFLTDYASYNDGSQFQFGHWVHFSNFNDAEDLQEYITEHFKDADIKNPLPCGTPREEVMITDCEGIPDNLYSESMNLNDFEKIFNYIEIMQEIGTLDNSKWIDLHNQYCENCNYNDDEIFEFDDDFFNTHFSDNPMRAAQAVFFGSIQNWGDDYLKFNGYGNLESFSDSDYSIEKNIDKDAILENILENPETYNL